MSKKDLELKISALNNLLLEQKDQINAIGNERDYWKTLTTELLKIAGFEVPETDGPLLRDDDGKLIGFESVREDFLKAKKQIDKN